MINRMDAIRKRGFNLIESAIVLGVVGLVVGGIWSAASAMIESYKVSKTIEGIFTISRNVQALISIADSNAIGNETVITEALVSSGSIPKDWVNGNTIKNPFGGNVFIYNRITGQNNRFFIEIDGIPNSACVNLITKISSIGSMANGNALVSKYRSGLGYISFHYPALLEVYNFPIPADTAANLCSSPNFPVNFGFGFGYTRNNN